MGNLITNQKSNAQALKLSNGATPVVMCVLALSASDLAETERQKQFAKWIGAHDQNIYGLGVVGFDISDIGWMKTNFAEQKQHVLAVIDKALSKNRWDVLPYDPPFAERQLGELRKLVEAFQPEFIEEDDVWAWSDHAEPPFELCEKHKVYLHIGGCIICHEIDSLT